jgi:hypothetical protein
LVSIILVHRLRKRFGWWRIVCSIHLLVPLMIDEYQFLRPNIYVSYDLLSVIMITIRGVRPQTCNIKSSFLHRLAADKGDRSWRQYEELNFLSTGSRYHRESNIQTIHTSRTESAKSIALSFLISGR